MRRKKVLHLALLAAIFGSFVAALAQDAERYAPKPPPHDDSPASIPEPPTQPVLPGADISLNVNLHGLVFVDSPDKINPRGVEAQGVVFDGTILDHPDFARRMQPHLGQPVTSEMLQAIAAEVVIFHREHDRPVVDALVPQQDVTAGVIQIIVLEGRVGEIRTEGNRYFSAERLRAGIRLQPGDFISRRRLLDDLDWINTNPFRRVDLIFERGSQLGTTDLVLLAQDYFPLRFYGGYENTGTTATDEHRWLAGFNWGDVFGLDHQLNYQFTSGPDANDFQAHWVSYIVPLPWRHTLTMLGSYTKTQSALGDPLSNAGESWQASARYDVPLPSFQNFEHQLRFGFDFKQSNNNLEFGGSSIFASDTDIDQWSVGYHANQRDRLGSTIGEATFVFSPGEITANNTDAQFMLSRPGANASYVYLNMRLERRTQLPFDLTWVVRAEGQIADGELLGSEQLGFGGMYFIRGFDERIFNTDQGILISNELLSPPISITKLFNVNQPDQLQFLVFFDWGRGWNRGNDPSVVQDVNLSSIGPGLRYNLGRYLSIRYDYGIQLDDDGAPRDDRHHLSIIASWTF